MRVITWGSEERVDLPDMTAMSWLVVGEFRRTLRALLMEHGVLGIVNGFKVVPAAPADATIKVVLDPGGGAAKSVAVGAENTGSTDAGQLIGDTGQEGLEGNAQYIYDLTPLAPGTWKIEMRFSYVPGASDNRAFWNDATNLEYIAAQNTRSLPTVELQAVAAYTGGEWLPLASVVWGGATVAAGNITDNRYLVFEGGSPWLQTAQDAVGSIPDFDRSDTRPDVTSDRVYSALRKLARQVQDIKGPDSDGKWSFHRRVVKAMDPGTLLPVARTKSIATLDTLEYVVGDGTTTWGDFYGASGLQDCLTHIAASEASLPSRIRIRLKSRQTGLAGYLTGGAPALGPIWTCPTEVAFATVKHIEIVADCSKADKSGRAPVAFTHTVNAYFTFATAGSLTLRNIAMHSVPTKGLFLSTLAVLKLDNSMIVSQNGSWVVRSNSKGLIWIDSEIYGAVNIFTNTSSTAGGGEGFLISRCSHQDRTVFGTHINSYLRFWADATWSDLNTAATWYAINGRIEQCGLYYGSNPAATATFEACIDVRGAQRIRFENIDYGVPADSNLHLLGCAGTGAARSVSANLIWEQINLLITTPTNAHHDVDAGYNTTKGTGWGWFCSNIEKNSISGAEALEGDVMRSCAWRNIRWAGLPMIDSGGICAEGVFEEFAFHNMRNLGCTFPAITYGGTPRLTGLSLKQDSNPGNGISCGAIAVSNCAFGRIGFSGTEPVLRGVLIDGGFERGLSIESSTFDVTDADGARNDTAFLNARSVVGVERKTGVGLVQVQRCRFQFFKPTGTDESCGVLLNSTGNASLEVDFCNFSGSTHCVVVEGTTPGRMVVIMVGNRFEYVTAASPFWVLKGDYLPAELSAQGLIHMIGNVVSGTPAGAITMVDCGLYTNNALLFVGNNFTRFGRVLTTTTNPVGLGTTPPMNIDVDMPVSLTGADKDEVSLRTAKTRVLNLSPLLLIGQDALGGLGASTWQGVNNDVEENANSQTPDAIGKISLSKIIPLGATITRVRIGFTRNAGGAGTATCSLKRRTIDFTTAFGGDTFTTVWTQNRAVAGDFIFDSGAIAANNSYTSSNSFYISVKGSDAGALDFDIVHWIELTYTDPGYRG